MEPLPAPVEPEQPDPTEDQLEVDVDPEAEDAGEEPTEEQPAIERIAPERRFAAARRSLGEFAASGSRDDLQRGLGHYARSGVGGASSGGARFGNSARVGGALFYALDGLRASDRRPRSVGLDKEALSRLPANEIAEKIVEAIAPRDGSQDREANREALAHAMSSLLAQEPDANLLQLTIEQIDLLMMGFLAEDLCRRIDLDVGQALFEKVDAQTAMTRFEEMRSFVSQMVNASFRARNAGGQTLNRSEAAALCASVYKDTLSVFAEYIS